MKKLINLTNKFANAYGSIFILQDSKIYEYFSYEMNRESKKLNKKDLEYALTYGRLRASDYSFHAYRVNKNKKKFVNIFDTLFFGKNVYESNA